MKKATVSRNYGNLRVYAQQYRLQSALFREFPTQAANKNFPPPIRILSTNAAAKEIVIQASLVRNERYASDIFASA